MTSKHPWQLLPTWVPSRLGTSLAVSQTVDGCTPGAPLCAPRLCSLTTVDPGQGLGHLAGLHSPPHTHCLRRRLHEGRDPCDGMSDPGTLPERTSSHRENTWGVLAWVWFAFVSTVSVSTHTCHAAFSMGLCTHTRTNRCIRMSICNGTCLSTCIFHAFFYSLFTQIFKLPADRWFDANVKNVDAIARRLDLQSQWYTA